MQAQFNKTRSLADLASLAAGYSPVNDSGEMDSTHQSAGSLSRETSGEGAETRWANDLHAARLRQQINSTLPPRVPRPAALPAAPVQLAPVAWQACPAHQNHFSVGHHVSLISAIRRQDMHGVARFIHEMPFRLDDKDASGRSALHYAVEEGAEAIVALLLRGSEGVGAHPDVRTFFGLTPLHIAAARGRPGLLALLIHHGADVNASTVFNASVLDLAGYWQRTQAVGTLLAWGARGSGMQWAIPEREKGLLRGWIDQHGAQVVSHMLAVSPAEALRLASDGG